MKPATTIAVQSDRYAVEWGDDGDASPPPGYDLAANILEQLLAAGLSSQPRELPKDSWEHSYWYFFVEHEGVEYRIDVQPSLEEEDPPIWVIMLSKCLGILKSIFGSNHLRYQVDDGFRNIVEHCVREVTASKNLTWCSEDEASVRYLGAAPSNV